MLRSTFAKLLLGFCVLSSSSLLTACGSEPASQDEPSATGSLSLPLVATAGAHTYRLQGYLYVSGPSSQYLDLSADAVTAQLSTGEYRASLYYWQLTRADGSGNFRPVDAQLMSDSAPAFTIFNGATSTISFQFQTDGLVVTVGAGTLNVKLDVTETPPPCTPLGADCAAGTWCPPPELTGTAAHCIGEGPLAEGDACNSPLDCAANTSCIDSGGGARCTLLCDGSAFGLPCPSGGTCTAVGVDYGVCTPSL